MAANTWKKGVHYIIIIVIDALRRVDQEILLKVLISYYFTFYSVSFLGREGGGGCVEHIMV